MAPGRRRGLAALLWLALLMLCVFRFDWLQGPLTGLFGSKQALRSRGTLPEYLWQHLELVALSTGASLAVALPAALLLRLKAFSDFRKPLLAAATFLETLPSAAVLALAVPAMGYGRGPVLAALVFYGILPVLRSSVEGLDAVSEDLITVARGLGMNRRQQLWRVRWPLALPAIFAGLRTTVIISISAATLGATVGTGGLGVLILNGLRSMDIPLVIKGALPVSLLALLAGSLFSWAEAAWFRAG